MHAVAAKGLLRSEGLCGQQADELRGELRGEQSRAELRGEQSRACLHVSSSLGEGASAALPLSPGSSLDSSSFPSRRLGRAPMRLAPTANPCQAER